MNEQLSTLIELQEIDTTIGALKTKLTAIPARIDQLRSGYQHEQAVEKDLAASLEQLRHDHRQSSRELDDQEAKIKKVKDQELMIKSNKEFEVFKHELQVLVQKRGEIEEVILSAMERTEEVEKALRAQAALVERAKGVFTVEEKRLVAEQTRLREELERQETFRDGIAGRLSEENRRAYLRLRDHYQGLAVTPVRNGICQGCHLELRPQRFQEVKRNDQILTCDQCKRILFHEQPADHVPTEH